VTNKTLLKRVKHAVAGLTGAKPESAWFRAATTMLLSTQFDSATAATLSGYPIEEVEAVIKHNMCRKKDWSGKAGVQLFLFESIVASGALPRKGA